MDLIKVRLEFIMPLLLYRIGFRRIKKVIGLTHGMNSATVDVEVEGNFYLHNYDIEWLKQNGMSLNVSVSNGGTTVEITFNDVQIFDKQRMTMNIPFDLYETIVRSFIVSAFNVSKDSFAVLRPDAKAADTIRCRQNKSLFMCVFNCEKPTIDFLMRNGYTFSSKIVDEVPIFIIIKN